MSRGLVSLLFTDLVGSTRLLDHLGEQEAGRLRQAHFRVLRAAVTAHGGREVKNLGDGVMAVFGSAVDAVASAVTIQLETRRHALRADLGPEEFAVRVGIHVGEPETHDDDYFGTPVVIASRLCEAARGGQILVSSLVRQLVGDDRDVHFVDVGALELKGLPEAVASAEIAWSQGVDVRPPLPAALAPGEVSPYVGRDRQQEALRRALDQAAGGTRTTVVVTGEAGIGKTRLAARAAADAHEAGATVLFGRCEADPVVPYQPFVEALRHYLEHSSIADREAGSEDLWAELARLLPEIAGTEAQPFGDTPPPSIGDETGLERYRMFEAVVAVLQDAAAVNPVMLVLDDLQSADRSTIRMLRHLDHSPTLTRLLMVITVSDPASVDDYIADTLHDLHRHGAVEYLDLGGLERDEVGELIRQWLERDADTATIDAVLEQTNGNPFFVEEILHLAAVENGQAGIPVEDLPGSVVDAVERRLRRIDTPCREVLSLASIAGPDFDAESVRLLAGLAIDDVIDLLDQAEAVGLLREGPEPFSYRFTHLLARQVLYRGFGATRRATLHDELARIIEKRHSHQLEHHAGALAHHYAEAAAVGASGKAVHYSSMAGWGALAQFAYDEAAKHFQRALDFARAHPDVATPLSELLLGLGTAGNRLGNETNAQEALHEAADAAIDEADPTALGRIALELARAVEHDRRASARERAADVLRRALERISPEDDRLRAQLLGRLAVVTYWSAPVEERDELARGAIAAAESADDPAVLASALASRMLALWSPDNVEERLTLAERVLALIEAAPASTPESPYGATELALQARRWRLMTRLEAGDLRDVDEDIEEHTRLAEELRQPLVRSYSVSFGALREIMRGRLDEGARLAREALRLGLEGERANAEAMYVGQMLPIWLARDERDQLERLAEANRRVGEDVFQSRAILAHLEAELGAHGAARSLLDEVVIEAAPRDNLWTFAVSRFATAAEIVGHREAAGRLYDLLQAVAGRVVTMGPPPLAVYGPVDLYLGKLAHVRGDPALATEHLDAAIAIAEGLEMPIHVAEARFGLGRVLLDQGDQARAHDQLRQALDAARSFGAAALERRARDLLG